MHKKHCKTDYSTFAKINVFCSFNFFGFIQYLVLQAKLFAQQHLLLIVTVICSATLARVGVRREEPRSARAGGIHEVVIDAYIKLLNAQEGLKKRPGGTIILKLRA